MRARKQEHMRTIARKHRPDLAYILDFFLKKKPPSAR